MNRSQLLIISSASMVLMAWLFFSYQNLQTRLKTPLAMPLSKQTSAPLLPLDIAQMLLMEQSGSMIVKNNALWGIVPSINLSKPFDPNAVLFTPASSSKPARLCVGLACYEFLGLDGKKAIFYDTNVSAINKILTLGSGATIRKPLRVKKITRDAVIVVDTKKRANYELSLFKIDLTPYKPQSDPKKGN